MNLNELYNLNRLYVGIDPEKQGGLAYIYHSKDSLTTTDIGIFPTSMYSVDRLKMLFEILDGFNSDEDHRLDYVSFTIEKIWLFGGQHAKHEHEFSSSYGIWTGICTAIGEFCDVDYKVNVVPAKTWKRKVIGEVTSDKSLSVDAAVSLFKGFKDIEKLTKGQSGITTKNISDMAEALLIAFYGYHILDGNSLG